MWQTRCTCLIRVNNLQSEFDMTVLESSEGAASSAKSSSSLSCSTCSVHRRDMGKEMAHCKIYGMLHATMVWMSWQTWKKKGIAHQTQCWTGSQQSPPGSMWSFNSLRAISLLVTLSVVNHSDYEFVSIHTYHKYNTHTFPPMLYHFRTSARIEAMFAPVWCPSSWVNASWISVMFLRLQIHFSLVY